MGAYYCVLCDSLFCDDDVICHPYGPKGTELICEDCYLNKTEKGRKESEE